MLHRFCPFCAFCGFCPRSVEAKIRNTLLKGDSWLHAVSKFGAIWKANTRMFTRPKLWRLLKRSQNSMQIEERSWRSGLRDERREHVIRRGSVFWIRLQQSRGPTLKFRMREAAIL